MRRHSLQALREWLEEAERNPDEKFEAIRPVILAAMTRDELDDRPWWRRAAYAAGEQARRGMISRAAAYALERLKGTR